MTAFWADDAGNLCCEIEDHKGHLRLYHVRPLSRPGAMPWRCELLRLDAGSAHAVTLGEQGWSCACEDAHYRPSRRFGRCKHKDPAAAYRALCLALAAQMAPFRRREPCRT